MRPALINDRGRDRGVRLASDPSPDVKLQVAIAAAGSGHYDSIIHTLVQLRPRAATTSYFLTSSGRIFEARLPSSPASSFRLWKNWTTLARPPFQRFFRELSIDS